MAEGVSVTRKRHSSGFKAKVALEAASGRWTANEVASRHGLHPTQVSQWKRQLTDGADQLFARGNGRHKQAEEEQASRLYEEIGRLKMELEWVKKKAALFE